MGSPSAVITLGLGSFGSVNLLITLGYGAGVGLVDNNIDGTISIYPSIRGTVNIYPMVRGLVSLP